MTPKSPPRGLFPSHGARAQATAFGDREGSLSTEGPTRHSLGPQAATVPDTAGPPKTPPRPLGPSPTCRGPQECRGTQCRQARGTGSHGVFLAWAGIGVTGTR